MISPNNDFYVWSIAECIQNTYKREREIMPMYSIMEKHFPNALRAIHKVYSGLIAPEFYEADLLSFEQPKYVYEAISSLIPSQKRIMSDLAIIEQCEQYKALNTYCTHGFECIRRINLIMAIFLSTEEFVLEPITDKNVSFTDTNLIVQGEFVTCQVSKDEGITCISIIIPNVLEFQYRILT